MNDVKEGSIDWANIVEHCPFVLHVPTQIIGRVTRYWDGEKDVHISPHGRPVKCAVVGFESGHTFVANKDENFIVLAPHIGPVAAAEELLVNQRRDAV